MDRFRTMQSFVEVIRLGSFSEAAKILGLSRALISRHITDLERTPWCPVADSDDTPDHATEAGAEHFNFCQRIIKEIEEKETSLKQMQREPAGSLKILAPKSLTTLALGDAIASFATASPHLSISLMLDDLSFRSYDFIERGFDVAVHTTPIRESSLVARKIATLRWLLCASSRISQAAGRATCAERSHSASMLSPSQLRSERPGLASPRHHGVSVGKGPGTLRVQ